MSIRRTHQQRRRVPALQVNCHRMMSSLESNQVYKIRIYGTHQQKPRVPTLPVTPLEERRYCRVVFTSA